MVSIVYIRKCGPQILGFYFAGVGFHFADACGHWFQPRGRLQALRACFRETDFQAGTNYKYGISAENKYWKLPNLQM